MSIERFTEDELKVLREYKNVFGRTSQVYDTPITHKENYMRLYDGKTPMWIPYDEDSKVNIRVDVDPEVQAVYPKKRGARVKITMNDGRVFEKELYDLKGSPNAPIGWAELEKKYRGNVEGIFSDADADKLLDLIKSLASLEKIDGLMAILNEKR